MNGMTLSDMIQAQIKNSTGTVYANPLAYSKAVHSVTFTAGLSHLHHIPYIHTNPATIQQSPSAPTADKALIIVAVMIAEPRFASLSQRLQRTARNSDVTSGGKALTKEG